MNKFIFALAFALATPLTLAATLPTDSHLKAVSDMLVAYKYIDATKADYRQALASHGEAETPLETCHIRQFDDPMMLDTIARAYAPYLKESDAKLLAKFYNAHPDLDKVTQSDIDPPTAKALTHMDNATAAVQQQPHAADGIRTAMKMLDFQNCKG